MNPKTIRHLFFSFLSAGFCLVFLVAATPEKESAGELYDRMVAVINARPITLYDVKRTQSEPDLLPMFLGLPPDLPVERSGTWAEERTINDELALDAARSLGVDATEEVAENRLRDLRVRNGWDEERYRFALDQFGFANHESAVRAFQRGMGLAQIIRIKVGSRVNVDEKEIEEQMRRLYADGEETEVHLRQIFMAVPMIVRPSVELEIHQFMMWLHGSLERGEISFEEAAKKYSQSAEAAQGGSLGWTRRGTFQFDAQAFEMKPGHVSKVVRSFMGFHILQVKEKRRVKLDSPDRVRRAISEKMYQVRFMRELEKWYESLRNTSVVRVPPFEPLFGEPPHSS